uniref:Spindle and centriole-associated protein 1 n=1 Tax=Strongyloides papillosus TaxID=174720 RepID=A0A0N5BP00_STREA
MATIVTMLQSIKGNINKEINEKTIRIIKESNCKIYRLEESLEEMKIKLDDLLEMQLSSKNRKRSNSKPLYHLSNPASKESLEEMKIKLDDLLEMQLSSKNRKRSNSKPLYHLSNPASSLLMEATDEDIKDIVHQMRERCFGLDGGRTE